MGEVGKVEEKGNLNSDNFESPLTEMQEVEGGNLYLLNMIMCYPTLKWVLVCNLEE